MVTMITVEWIVTTVVANLSLHSSCQQNAELWGKFLNLSCCQHNAPLLTAIHEGFSVVHVVLVPYLVKDTWSQTLWLRWLRE